MRTESVGVLNPDMLSSELLKPYQAEKVANGGRVLDNKAQLNNFLARVEGKAFRIAYVAIGHREDALEIVQDTMFKLVQKYHKRPESEWAPLFYRILNNRITDHYRRNAIKQKLFGWLGFYNDETGEIENNPDLAEASKTEQPDFSIELSSDTLKATDAIGQLSARQREAFLLRAWEGLSVEDTAFAMGCSTGSVKTHYSRAIQSLRAALQDISPEHQAMDIQ